MHSKYGTYYGNIMKILSMNWISTLNVSNSKQFWYLYLYSLLMFEELNLNPSQNTKLLKMIIILTNNGQCKVIHQDSSACSWRSVDIFQLYNILSVYINLNKIASLSASIAWKTNIIFTNCSFDNIKTTMSIVMHSFWN